MKAKIRQIVVECSISEFKQILYAMDGNDVSVAVAEVEVEKPKRGYKKKSKKGYNYAQYEAAKHFIKQGDNVKTAIKKAFGRKAYGYDYKKLKE